MDRVLSSDALQELRELIDNIDRTLDDCNYLRLARAQVGTPLSKTNSRELILVAELSHVRRIRELLGLPARVSGGRTKRAVVPPADGDKPLREQLVKSGIEPATYRNVRLSRERRIAAKKSGDKGNGRT